MIIYPAIDIKQGRCVRLQRGDMNKATVYGDDPGAMAASFAAQGAQWIHAVDLDGAFAGGTRNREAIMAIVAQGVPVQLGGGIRGMAQLCALLDDIGVSRAILGTAAVQDEAFLREAVQAYGRRIAVGIDARDGYVAVKGWAQATQVTPLALARRIKALGVQTVIYTDIARDGMLTGPNLEDTRLLAEQTGLDVILSGGVSGMRDITRAAQAGLAGVIVGKALYTGAVNLTEAIREANACLRAE